MKYSITEAAKKLGITAQTLRNWTNEGKAHAEITSGGHRRYDESEIMRLAGRREQSDKITVAYARVSKPTQKTQLEQQRQILELYCAAKGWKYELIEDVGSGFDCNKVGLSKLIGMIESNQVERLVLNYKDRFLRFGSEIIFELCKYHDVEVVVVSENESGYDDELIADTLSVISHSAATLYGRESFRTRKIMQETKKLFKEKVVSNEEEGSEE